MSLLALRRLKGILVAFELLKRGLLDSHFRWWTPGRNALHSKFPREAGVGPVRAFMLAQSIPLVVSYGSI